MATSIAQVNQIERQVKRIERDLTKIRFTLQKLKTKRRATKLTAVQKSIAAHLISDEDPVKTLSAMRRRNGQ